MTFEKLNKLFVKNNIPKNVKLMGDSGWECDATDMDGVWYNKQLNIVVFTQNYSKFGNYANDENWECIYGELKNDE